MMMTLPTNILLTASALALTALVCGSCNNQRNVSGDVSGSQRVSTSQLADDDLDLGDDWSRTSPLRPASRDAAPQTGRAAPSSTQPSQQRAAAQASRPWSVVLNTYSDENHAESAKSMLAQLGNVAPQLVGGAHVHTTVRGSMVLYGAYSSPEDARARADLDRIKAITFQNVPVFPRAFLTRAGALTARDHPHSLLSVRRMHPDIDPLYTLQVAAWSDFDSGQMTPEQVRRNAEAYAQELRARGLEAYFHHGGSGISAVTVGVFTRHDYDVQQGDLNPELTRLRREFPEYLVNGEPVQELIDRYNPRRGTRVQEPRLVLVPRR